MGTAGSSRIRSRTAFSSSPSSVAARACLKWTSPSTSSTPSPVTGNRACPVAAASCSTSVAVASASMNWTRGRGVITSAARRLPKATERFSSSAVPTSSVPRSADREASDASSEGLRAEASSSLGSIPMACRTRLAIPFSSRIRGPASAVKPRWKPTTARPTRIGWAIAQFFGTSSPKTIWAPVASTKATPKARPGVVASGTPRAPMGSRRRLAMAGSAMYPTTREVTVMPSWAPDSWVDRRFRAGTIRRAPRSPSVARRSTSARSTVTRENSAATNRALAAIRSTANPSSSAAVIVTRAVVDRPCAQAYG